ncbi:hypothetical protein ACHBHL_05200, partial [Streptococcus sp. A27]|uniref:hypothetical protein n=1 Tax=unclassified Streptococcus TaxID=2608887 RepID=UPI00374D345C
FYTELGNSSISDEHVFFVALHFTTRDWILFTNIKLKTCCKNYDEDMYLYQEVALLMLDDKTMIVY